MQNLHKLQMMEKHINTSSLAAIIAVGYRINSERATRFRQWATKVLEHLQSRDAFLKFNDAEILMDKGKVTAEIAKAFAESEFEKYRVLQDVSYQRDFDRLIAESSDQRASEK